jgi:hypothetical protein
MTTPLPPSDRPLRVSGGAQVAPASHTHCDDCGNLGLAGMCWSARACLNPRHFEAPDAARAA